MAFNAEAARSGLFAAAIDIAEAMKKSEIPHAEAALLTGAVEFVAQLWHEVGIKAGKSPAQVRKMLEKQVRTFFIKHTKASYAPERTVQ